MTLFAMMKKIPFPVAIFFAVMVSELNWRVDKTWSRSAKGLYADPHVFESTPALASTGADDRMFIIHEYGPFLILRQETIRSRTRSLQYRLSIQSYRDLGCTSMAGKLPSIGHYSAESHRASSPGEKWPRER